MSKEEQLLKLKKGSIFNFRNLTWEVVDSYRYDWEGNESTFEFKIKSGVQEAFIELELDEDEEMVISFGTEVYLDQFKPEVTIDKFTGEEVLTEISYLGSSYELDEIDNGILNELSSDDPSMKLTNFYYTNGDYFVNIIIWEDQSLDGSAGEEIDIDMIDRII